MFPIILSLVVRLFIIVFLVLFLLYFRFAPKDTLVVLLTPMSFGLGIPYAVPLAMGLLGTPTSAVSVGCGVIVTYLIDYIYTDEKSRNVGVSFELISKLLKECMESAAVLSVPLTVEVEEGNNWYQAK